MDQLSPKHKNIDSQPASTGLAVATAKFAAELGDGLLLRRGRPEDADALAAFNARVHASIHDTEPNESVSIYTRDLLLGKHPTVRAADFTVVEDTTSGAIVSSCNLIGQRWSFGGIALGVGRPELVGTHPDYRRRGLVRAQFELLHQWSHTRGDLMQAITGIPFYYRQFGYEMAVDIGGGGTIARQHVPVLKPGIPEAYRVRRATEHDVDAIAALYGRGRERVLLFAERDRAMWSFLLHGASPGSLAEIQVQVIESADGEMAGFVAHGTLLFGTALPVFCCELRPGVSWLAVVPILLRALLPIGDRIAAAKNKTLSGIRWGLDPQHPIYAALRSQLLPQHPYALYLRVPDLPHFVRQIAPVLEGRLPGTVGEGYSGELKLSFYRSGLRLRWQAGRLAEAVAWQPPNSEEGDAVFPGLVFLQLLFGYRSLPELHAAFPDCYGRNDTARALLDALFPKHASQVWAID